jgi:type IV secretory pathway protease TraF
MGFMVGLALCSVPALARYRLTVNVGQSLPGRLYACHALAPEDGLPRGVVVLYVPPARVQATVRRLAPQADLRRPWLKQVAAISGDEVCWHAAALVVNQVSIAPLPLLQPYALAVPETCTILAPEEVLPLGSAPNSFDGRYTGPLTREELTAVCTALF